MEEINETTLYVEFIKVESLIDEETKQNIIKSSQKIYGEYYDMTLDRLLSLLEPDCEEYERLNDPLITVFEVYWFLGFKEFFDSFLKLLQNFSIKESPDELAASRNCYPVEFSESVLIFTRSYFNSPSFKEAAKITIGEFLMAKKDAYNKAVFERTYANLKKK